MAAVRWTLTRLVEELEPLRDALPARVLRERVRVLAHTVGPGASRRPDDTLVGRDTAWVADALQAMGWVAEERGLGGARSLDGMSWDLAVDARMGGLGGALRRGSRAADWNARAAAR